MSATRQRHPDAALRIGISLISFRQRRISVCVNQVRTDRFRKHPRSPAISAFSWLFALVLCCLPGISLYDPALTSPDNKPQLSTTPSGQAHAANTLDSALTSSMRMVVHAERSGSASPDTTDTPAPEFQPWLTPMVPDVHQPPESQGYDTGSLVLTPPFHVTTGSPRAPPVLA